jgi:hypothetical protein
MTETFIPSPKKCNMCSVILPRSMDSPFCSHCRMMRRKDSVARTRRKYHAHQDTQMPITAYVNDEGIE